jgi:hypothetical protein
LGNAMAQKELQVEYVAEKTYMLYYSLYVNVAFEHIVTYWVYITRQITSRHIQYRGFITHSLVHLYNLQSHNYCHLQYYKYFSRSHFCTLNNNGLHSQRTNHSLTWWLLDCSSVQVQVQVTLRLTVSQSVSKSWYRAPFWGP